MKGRWFNRAAVACVLPAALMLSGCDSVTGLIAGGVDGTYVLATVNGQGLPAVIGSDVFDGTVFETRITSGELVLEDGEYDVSIGFDIRSNGSTLDSGTNTDSGTFEVDGDEITFDPGTDEELIGTVDGNRVRLSAEGISLVFEKD